MYNLSILSRTILYMFMVVIFSCASFYVTDAQESPNQLIFEIVISGKHQIYSVNSNSTNLVPLVETDGSTDPIWSPDGTKIAFLQKINKSVHIFIIDLSTGFQRTVTPFTPDNSINSDVDWSPDSKRIVFSSNRTGNPEIYTIKPDGTDELTLTQDSGFNVSPRWSPDGKHIVFVSERSGTKQIYIMRQDGSEQVQLTNSNKNNTFPFWSPDGKTIAFSSNRDGNVEIYTISDNGQNEQNITQNPSYDYLPRWSPDGKKIAFVSNRDSNQISDFNVFVMNHDGTEQTRLTQDLSNSDYPAWSPDGTEIVVTSYTDEVSQIYIINADGQNAKPLLLKIDYDKIYAPQWRPKPSK